MHKVVPLDPLPEASVYKNITFYLAIIKCCKAIYFTAVMSKSALQRESQND